MNWINELKIRLAIAVIALTLGLTMGLGAYTLYDNLKNEKSNLQITKYQVAVDAEGTPILLMRITNINTDVKVIGVTYIFPDSERF